MEVGVQLAATLENAGELLADAQALEAAGAGSLWVGGATVAGAGSAGSAAPDPLLVLAAVAVVTSRIRLGVGVVAAPLRGPVELAVSLATLDRLALGRLRAGLGAAGDPAWYEAVGVPFAERGERLAEAVHALRHLWSGAPVPFAGSFYRFPPLSVPSPRTPGGPPLLVGGDSALDRAAAVAGGYIHEGGDPESVSQAWRRLRPLLAAQGRAPGDFEFWVRAPAPAGKAELKGLLGELEELGVTGVILGPDPRLLDMLRNLDAEDGREDLQIANG